MPITLEKAALQAIDFTTIEIIVVNNNSTDGTESTCLEFQQNNPDKIFKYVLETRQGLSFARNRGINEAKGSIICFIDDDAYVDPHFSKNLISFYDKNPDIFSTGGRIIPIYEDSEPAWMSKYLLPLVAALDLGEGVKKFKSGKYPIGANMAFRKQVFEKIGFFDTNLGRKGDQLESGEEKDLFKRLNRHHKTFYLGNVTVNHIIPNKRTTKEYIQKMGQGYGRSERIRVTKSGKKAVLFKVFEELFKVAASFFLFALFTFKLQPEKGKMLIKFRWWVIQGLLK